MLSRGVSFGPVSFHLVDRIVELEPARRARGCLTVPADAASFPPCLVVEAIGQLAGWMAVHESGGESRPVAARVGEVRILGDATPGETLDLEVELRSARRSAIAYEGRARMGAVTIVEMESSVGAMLPMAELEQPGAARARLARLLGPGLERRPLPRVEALAPRVLRLERGPGPSLVGEIEVAGPGPLYADHFPLRPVYPATLLLDAQIRLATELVAATMPEVERVGLATLRVRDVKVRSFTPPGGRVEVRAEVLGGVGSAAGGATQLALSAAAAGARVSSASLLVGMRPARRGGQR